MMKTFRDVLCRSTKLRSWSSRIVRNAGEDTLLSLSVDDRLDEEERGGLLQRGRLSCR